MKVLVLSSTYPPHALGGYELSCDDVMTRWRSKGHEVEVLTTTMRVPGVAEVDEPHVHRDLHWYWKDHQLRVPRLSERIAIERVDQLRLTQALATKPDVVSVWAMGAMPMQLITTLVASGIPSVLVVCDDWLDYGPRIDPWTRMFLGKPVKAAAVQKLANLPTRWPDDLGARTTAVFVSERTRDFSPVFFSDSTVIPSGIDRVDFPAMNPVDREWRGRLLCVGRVDPRKGFASAVAALDQLSGMTLDIVGQPDPSHAAELIAPRVSFDAVPRAELAKVYADHDVLLFTSTWDEPFGLVPLEAMACSTPVIAVASGGAADYLVDGVNCVVVPPSDPTAIAAAVRRLEADPALRAALVRGGLKTAADYTTDKLATALLKVHRRVAGR